MIALEARGLAVTPPGSATPVVEGFSLALGRGEWVAVTGPNGGGKTSLLLALAGLWPAEGELRLAGAPFGPGSNPAARRRLAVVLQDPSSQTLQPTVAEEIGFGPRNQGASEAEVEGRVSRWSDVLGLSEDLVRDPARLSAGRQQMVLLAAALACDPEVLIADEPTAHLDRESRAMVLARIGDRVAAGLAVIWATQMADELAAAHRAIAVGGVSRGTTPPARRAVEGRPLLRVRIGTSAALDGPRVAVHQPVELTVADRGVTGIVGRNGAGKSVILGAIAGLDAPAQLELSWQSAHDPPPIAALQFPEQQVFEEHPVAEVTFAAISRGMARAEAEELARNYLRDLDLDLDRLAERRTWSLSTGEKRLLEVVAALISPACLTILDEPTAGLDPARKAALGNLIEKVSIWRPVLVASQDRDWLAGLASLTHDLDPLDDPGKWLWNPRLDLKIH